MRLCLASTPGGHLSELEWFVERLGQYDKFLVTVESPHSLSVLREIRQRYVRRVERNPANLLLNALQALAILLKDKPDVIISTGAGDVLPLMMLGASLGIRVVFIESVARVRTPSVTGRIVKRWVDLIILPWPSLRRAYPRGVEAAPLVSPGKPVRELPAGASILILTGTGPRGFDRLLRAMDSLVAEKRLPGQVFAQIGASTYVPEHYRYERFLPHEKLLEAIQAADLVVTHDGAGSIRESLSAGKPVIVVSRQSRSGEVLYRRSAELAHHLASLGWVTIVDDVFEIPGTLAASRIVQESILPGSGRNASEILLEFLRSLERNPEAPLVTKR